MTTKLQSLLSFQNLVSAFVVLVAVDGLLFNHPSTHTLVWADRIVRALSLICLGGVLVARVHEKR